MKKLFYFLTVSFLLFSCSNDDQIKSNDIDEKIIHSIQKIKYEFNSEYKLIPNHDKFKNIDWNNPTVFIYGENQKGISLKTFNSKNENEFNLLIGYDKLGEEFYILSTDKEQKRYNDNIIMEYNNKTIVYNQTVYIDKRSKNLTDLKYSTRGKGLITGSDPREEWSGVYIYINPGNRGYYNPGRTGNYLDLDSMYDLDNGSRGGGSSTEGGGIGSAVITSPAPDDLPLAPKPYEICNKSINVKQIGNSYNAYLSNLGLTLVNSNGRVVNVKIPNLAITVPSYNISSSKFEENIKGAWSIAIQKSTKKIGNNPNPTVITRNIQIYMKEWLAKTSFVKIETISVSTSIQGGVPETKIEYCL